MPEEIRLPAVSTAGAGDALLGGVLSALVAGLPLIRSESISKRLNDDPIATALELGVLLGSYKVTSPHTIHPSASLDALLNFAGENGIQFSTDIRRGECKHPIPS